ncbi:unnamed protein product [Anisakis simplex]|uniref:Uncharacterized protein n=1 Tax=Anisakis simplex TaxID=6269 RepID=A0A0M3K1U0_ANISI|nr:unnamed protein product [Anisakis simplex]
MKLSSVILIAASLTITITAAMSISSTSTKRFKRSLADCTFADIFLKKVDGCDIKQLYERRKSLDFEEKMAGLLKRKNAGFMQRTAPFLPEIPPG